MTVSDRFLTVDGRRWWLRADRPAASVTRAASAPKRRAAPVRPAETTDQDDAVEPLRGLPERTAVDSCEPAALPFTADETSVPALSSFVPGNRHRWAQLQSALDAALGDDAVDSVLLTTHDQHHRPLTRYALDLTLLEEPRWTVSTLVDPRDWDRLNPMERDGWYIWASPDRVDWARPDWLATEVHLYTATRPLLAVYKTPYKRAAVRAGLTAVGVQIHTVGLLRVEVVRVDTERVKRRRNWTRKVTQHLPRKPRGDVLANCAVCGQPLTTPASARIGIGPLCLERVRENRGLPPDVHSRPDLLGAIARNTAPVAYWARAKPAKRWASTLGERLRIN